MNSVDNYRFQLEQVEAALLNDANNVQLQQLVRDLRQALILAEELTSYKAVDVKPVSIDGETEIEPDFVLESLRPGDICEAQFSGDGIWYAARIDTISQDYKWFTVTYVDYGNSETLYHSKIRLLNDEHKVKRDTAGRIIEDKNKAKKLKAIKFRRRVERQETEQKDKQKAWLDFQQKGIKKKGNFGKGSIFASKDTVGSKIGVTNSGQGMTQFLKREKYVFPTQNDTDLKK